MTSYPPGAAAYFMLLLCVKAIYTFLIMPTFYLKNAQISFSRKPDPLNARSLRSLGFPKSPPLENPRSANV